MSENTNNELRCKVCGKLASEDSQFNRKSMLCNRHYLQIRIHGEVTDSSYIETTKRDYWTDEEIDQMVIGVCVMLHLLMKKSSYIEKFFKANLISHHLFIKMKDI